MKDGRDTWLVQAIAQALGLPIENVTRLEIIFDGPAFPVVKVTYNLDHEHKAEEIGSSFAEYELHRREPKGEPITMTKR